MDRGSCLIFRVSGDGGQMLNYWKPTLTLSQVDYTAVFHRNHIPSIFAGHITFQK